jgi:hypothetical protein
MSIIKPTSATKFQTSGLPRVEVTSKERAEFNRMMGVKEDVSAKWKLEIHLLSERSWHRPYRGAIRPFESGRYLHGEGDASAFWCMHLTETDAVAKGYGCGKIISADITPSRIVEGRETGGRVICPHCFKSWDSRYLTQQRVLTLNTTKWAEVLAFEISINHYDIDLYLKFHKVDLQPVAMGSVEELANARNSREPVMYTKEDIIHDACASGDLTRCIRAFLEA